MNPPGMRGVIMQLAPGMPGRLDRSDFPVPARPHEVYSHAIWKTAITRRKSPTGTRGWRTILKVTYGCIVYQEQVMQIFRELAGYSLGRADIVRRAMSKKKEKRDGAGKGRSSSMGCTDEDGNVLVEGCMRRGVPRRRGAWRSFQRNGKFCFLCV